MLARIRSKGEKYEEAEAVRSTLIEIQRSPVDPVLFSRSSRPGPPSSVPSLERGERNSIIPEDRISPATEADPFLLLSFPPFFRPSARPSFLPSFLLSGSQPPASSRTDPPAAGIPHFLYPPAFLTTPRDLHPLLLPRKR